MGDHRQLLPPLLSCVEAGELLDDSVEPTEQRLELAVRHFAVLHVRSLERPPETVTAIFAAKRANGEGTRCKSGTVPPL